MRKLFLATGFALASSLLAGASCDKKTTQRHDPGPVGVGVPGEAPKDVPGIDQSALRDEQKAMFQRLLDRMQSPCGNAESLRVSVDGKACKRAPFAAAYLVRRLAEDLPEGEVGDLYEARYLPEKSYKFKLEDAPFEGRANAPVVLVEFFDYGCPHCKEFVPLLEDVLAEADSNAVLYFKHFPLGGHPDSVPAAMAAVAAQRQGKFRDMHHKLFENQDAHDKASLFGYARELGLDMARFERDFNDPRTRARVEADRAEGDAADLRGTPTLYIGGRKWPEDEGMSKEEIVAWVKEEAAVNR